MKVAILVLASSILAREASAQARVDTRVVQGVVNHLDTKEPVPDVIVEAIGTDQSARSDASGCFTLELPVGSNQLRVNDSRFRDFSQNVMVTSDGENRADLIAVPVAGGRKVISVEGEQIRTSDVRRLEVERIDTASVSEVIAVSQQKAETGGDAGAITKRAPGITVEGGKFVFVRGLGKRYSATLVNSATMPSPEPDQRVIPLDLFPTSLIESISIVKSYSPDLPGEFSGGSVNIETRGLPDEDFVTLSLGLAYTHGTTLRDFSTYQGGNLDLFGYDDGTRSLPDEVPIDAVRVGAEGRGLDEATVRDIGRSFPNTWSLDRTSAPPDHKVALAFGKIIRSEEDDMGPAFGIVGSLNWENSHLTTLDEEFRLLKNQGTIEDPDPFVFNDFKLNSSVFESKVSALLNATLRMNEGQTIGLRNFYTHQSEDLVREQFGLNGQLQENERIQLLRYVEKGMVMSQLYGEHLLDGGPLGELLLEWRGSYALSNRDAPDDRQIRYEFIPAINDFQFYEVSGSGSREFYLLDENIYNAGVDLSIPFQLPWYEPPEEEEIDPTRLDPPQKIKIGASYLLRDRDFDARRFRYVAAGRLDENGNTIDFRGPPEELFQTTNIHPDGFVLNEVTRTTDNYDAEWEVLAGYALIDTRIARDWRFSTGVRAESSTQTVRTFELFGDPPDVVLAELENLDLLPAASLVWEFAEAMNLRIAASRTVTRPEFRELARFEFTDVAGGFAATGNPDLDRTQILNFDLRYDWFPGGADVVSASVFYKDFTDPIEQIIVPTGSSPLTTWENADSADLWGVEFEAQKRLDFLGVPELEEFRLLVNAAWIESEVSIAPSDSLQLTSPSRPLQGQPDYILNLGLVWEREPGPGLLDGVSVGIFANTFGERLSAVGAFGVPDQVEQPRWSVDLGISKEWGQSTIKLSAKNILDDEYEFTQGDFATRRYSVGFTLGISYAYKF